MASNEFIQSLIEQLSAEGVKSAADDEQKSEKKEKSKDDKDDSKDKRENAFRERMRRAKEKDKDDEEKKANFSFDVLTGLESLPEDLRKLASAEATSQFLADMARQSLFGSAAAAPVYHQEKAASASDEADLFNQVFEMHTAKLAALDPEYGMMLAAEQEKMAFNQGFEDAVLQVQQNAGMHAFNQFGGF